MLFWEDMIALLVCLKYYYFYVNIKLLSWIFQIWILISQLKKNYIKIMPSSTPHQKFSFYHLPTWERAGIKLGDAWYVSNVSIIFDCSMLYYLLFWTILGFIFHFYIIFGTNLLTGGPAQNSCFFACFRVSKKRNTKRSPKNETFRNMIFSSNTTQETWTLRQAT